MDTARQKAEADENNILQQLQLHVVMLNEIWQKMQVNLKSFSCRRRLMSATAILQDTSDDDDGGEEKADDKSSRVSFVVLLS